MPCSFYKRLLFLFFLLLSSLNGLKANPYNRGLFEIDWRNLQLPSLAFPTVAKLDAFLEVLSSSIVVDSINNVRLAEIGCFGSDYCLFQLAQNSIQKVPPEFEKNTKAAFSFFVLRQLGIDVILAYSFQDVFVYAASAQKVYELPYFQFDNKTYYNLLSEQHPGSNVAPVFTQIWQDLQQPLPPSRLFHFWPGNPNERAPSPNVLRSFSFSFEGQSCAITIAIDSSFSSSLGLIPMLEESIYIQHALPPYLLNQLSAQLSLELDSMDIVQKIKKLVTFCRSSFNYQTDEAAFGRERPMVAEEVLLAPFSDCEDRVALLFQLVVHLIKRPVIAIAFDDHVSLGIDIPEFEGAYVKYASQKFFICDPTGPINSSEIGVFPPEYEQKPYHIICSWKPQP